MSFLHDVEVISFLPDTSISKFFTVCRLMLEQSVRRPVGMLDNERYAAYSVWCVRRILPSIAVRQAVCVSVYFCAFSSILLFDPSIYSTLMQLELFLLCM